MTSDRPFKPSLFYGAHRSCPSWVAGEHNRRILSEKGAAISVSPADLVQAVDGEGVCPYLAKELVELLIQRSVDAAVARALGLETGQ